MLLIWGPAFDVIILGVKTIPGVFQSSVVSYNSHKLFLRSHISDVDIAGTTGARLYRIKKYGKDYMDMITVADHDPKIMHALRNIST